MTKKVLSKLRKQVKNNEITYTPLMEEYQENIKAKSLVYMFFLLSFWLFSIVIVFSSFLYTVSVINKTAYVPEINVPRRTSEPEIFSKTKIITAYVTGYNTIPEQTDASPCISASGDDICGRSDTIACPRNLPFYTWVEIDGKLYQCVDRTNAKYNRNFDINCNLDMKCPYKITGQKEVIIYLN